MFRLGVLILLAMPIAHAGPVTEAVAPVCEEQKVEPCDGATIVGAGETSCAGVPLCHSLTQDPLTSGVQLCHEPPTSGPARTLAWTVVNGGNVTLADRPPLAQLPNSRATLEDAFARNAAGTPLEHEGPCGDRWQTARETALLL